MLVAALVLVSLAAEPLTPQQAAQIRVDTDAAKAEVLQQYGNKKQSELTSEERRAVLRGQMEAERKVLQKAGVDPQTWARYEQTRSRADYAELAAAQKALEDAKKGDKKKAGADEVVIQAGVDVDEAKGDVPVEAGFDAEAGGTPKDGVEFESNVEIERSGAGAEAAPQASPAPKAEPPGRRSPRDRRRDAAAKRRGR